MKRPPKSRPPRSRGTSPATHRTPLPRTRISPATDSIQSTLAILGSLTFLWIGSLALPVQAEAEPCREEIRALEAKRDNVAAQDGLWTLFERSPELRNDSSLAMQVDSSANKLIANLIYLCETQQGVPLTELADFVQRKVAEQGAERFKQEMILLGKPPKEIDVWIEYAEIAVRNQKRTLKPETIHTSIVQGEKLMDAYARIAERLENPQDVGSLRATFLKLKQNMERFFASDPYVSLAILENVQIPYWDIDENHGGS